MKTTLGVGVRLGLTSPPSRPRSLPSPRPRSGSIVRVQLLRCFFNGCNKQKKRGRVVIFVINYREARRKGAERSGEGGGGIDDFFARSILGPRARFFRLPMGVSPSKTKTEEKETQLDLYFYFARCSRGAVFFFTARNGFSWGSQRPDYAFNTVHK